MYDTTIKEACDMLGIKPTRVRQLIKSGSLDAEKVAGIWLIDSQSIKARMNSKPKAGRPPLSAKSRDGLRRFTLMNRTHEVLSFNFDLSTKHFFDADEIHEAPRAPMSIVSPRGLNASSAELEYWWKHRSIPQSRPGIDRKLKALELAEAYEIPFLSMGLSLSDQYWIKPYGTKTDWKDINFFDNPFVETKPLEWLADVGLDSPDNTSEGVLSKRWITKRGKSFLLKEGGAYDQEPLNEVVATELCRRILDAGEYVAYTLTKFGESIVSQCPNFLTSEEEYIPAIYVAKAKRGKRLESDYLNYLDACDRLDIENADEALSKMLVIDYIMANTDRHWRNFGVVRNVETLECRIAPIFDTGTSLWCQIKTRDMEYVTHEIVSKPFDENEREQLRLGLEKAPKWLNLRKLEGFAEWTAEYLESFPQMEGRVDFIYRGISKRLELIHTYFEMFAN